MRKILGAAFLFLALAALAATIAANPATAHHPSYIWYNGYQYWEANHYNPEYCIYHHDYVYCRRASSY